MRKLAIVLGVLFSSSAFAQSSGIPWTNGRVLTAPMMQQFDAAKMNLNSLGKPGFAAKLDAHGRIDAPVVGDVSQARATTDGKTVSQIGQIASGSVQQTEKNAANGVAGLNDNAEATSPVQTVNIDLTRQYNQQNAKQISLANGYRMGGSGNWYSGGYDANGESETAWFGGDPLPDVPGGPTSDGTKTPINIMAFPYGQYNNGCGLCVLISHGNQTTAFGRAPLSEGASGEDDGVGIMETVDATAPAYLTLPVASYTASTVTLSTALTTDQMARLRVGMEIVTNSVDTTATVPPDDGFSPPKHYYAGVLKSWTPTTLTVWDWKSNTGSGSLPDTTHLDSYYSHLSVPTIFIGQPTKMFGRNLYVNYDMDRSGNTSGFESHNAEFEEADFQYSTTKARSIDFSGYVSSPQAHGGITDGSAFTFDSASFVGAGGVPSQILIDNNCLSRPFVSVAFFVNASGCGLNTGQASGTTLIMGQFGTNSDGNFIRHTIRAVQNDDLLPDIETGPVWRKNVNASLHDIQAQSWVKGYEGDIPYGYTKYGSDGTTSVCAQGDACGLIVTPDLVRFGNAFSLSSAGIDSNEKLTGQGLFSFWNNDGDGATYFVNVNPGATGGFKLYDTHTGDASTDGLLLLNINYTGADFGVDVSTTGTFTGKNSTISEKLVIPFATPASSTDTCTQGQIEMDADYIYSCVATNSWHRISNGASW
ncbi:hypothetical protein [Acetobacter senegalensis]|uniref:hypothetical protein n=1 Tax=Acetobacter senegalensis TaxID=446692 RepID=UPI00264EA399|nr:hypothetical protein [Acetobacter senegalensis]MDN7356332.1 hypothetical protein [Acetobacter senegalensis]